MDKLGISIVGKRSMRSRVKKTNPTMTMNFRITLKLSGYHTAKKTPKIDVRFNLIVKCARFTGCVGMQFAVTFLFETFYFIHMITILGFLIYIPGSKHLHLLAAAPNVFLKPLKRKKAMIKTDIEDEDAESFGLGKINELNWYNVLNLYACTECGRCQEQCPADPCGHSW